MHEMLHHHMPKSNGKGENALFDITAVLEASQGFLNALVYGYFTGDISQNWHLPLQALPCCRPCARRVEDRKPAKASTGVKGEGMHTAFLEHVEVNTIENRADADCHVPHVHTIDYYDDTIEKSDDLANDIDIIAGSLDPNNPPQLAHQKQKQKQKHTNESLALAGYRPGDEVESELELESHTQPLRSPLTEMPGTDDHLSSIMPVVLCVVLSMATVILLLVWVIHK